MHPAIGYQLATAQTAAYRCQAERDQAARAARRARRIPQPDPSHPAPWWSARTLTRHARLAKSRTA
jgi:hypothetical protein